MAASKNLPGGGDASNIQLNSNKKHIKQDLAVSYWNESNQPPYKVVNSSTRGKGKVVPVPGVSGSPSTLPKATRIASLSNIDIQHGERQDDPHPRVDRQLVYSWVPYYTLGDSPQSVYGAMSTMWSSKPLLMKVKKGEKGIFVVGELDFDRLSELSSKSNRQGIVVMCSDAKSHRFMEFDLKKNDARGPYYVREFETQMLSMNSVKDFVQCSRSWTKQKLFLKAPLQVDSDNNDILGQQCIDYVLEHVLDWESLDSIFGSQRFTVAKKNAFLEAGSRNGVLPERYSNRDQVVVQVSGRRRITMISPDQTFRRMYPYPTHHPYDGMAMASIETLERDRWPGVTDVSLQRAILEPGDALFVPAYWLIHVHDLDKENISIRVPLENGATTGRRAPAKDSMLVRVSRTLEDRVAQVVGVANTKRWLRIISKGNEMKIVDLGTVSGYKHARMCQEVRDDMEQSLGCGSWSTLLPLVIDRRLEPTPWLNENFREPLLLTDDPVIVQDTRTEEERKYPTLFRKKLEREGWHVEPTVSTVPIPGVNMPKDADYRMI
jgi:hypothetical protein